MRLLGLLTCTDGHLVRDHVWLNAFLLHDRQELQHLVRLLDLLTCTDGRDVRDDV